MKCELKTDRGERRGLSHQKSEADLWPGTSRVSLLILLRHDHIHFQESPRSSGSDARWTGFGGKKGKMARLVAFQLLVDGLRDETSGMSLENHKQTFRANIPSDCCAHGLGRPSRFIPCGWSYGLKS